MRRVLHAVLIVLVTGAALTGCASGGGGKTAHRARGGAAGGSPASGHHQAIAQTTAATATCPRATIKVPNLGINSTNKQNIKVTLTNPCPGPTQTANYAEWNAYHSTSTRGCVGGRCIRFSWTFRNNWARLPTGRTATAVYYPTQPLGAYDAEPWEFCFIGATIDQGRTFCNQKAKTLQNSPRFYIKANSRVALSGYRRGRNVFIRARVTRYNPTANNGLGRWQNSADRKVTTYYMLNGKWRSAAAKYTRGNGYTPYIKLTAANRRRYRATVTATGTIWGRTSDEISR